jgi:hypothetical protein
VIAAGDFAGGQGRYTRPGRFLFPASTRLPQIVNARNSIGMAEQDASVFFA